MKRCFLALSLLVLGVQIGFSQWRVGLTGGGSVNYHTSETGYAYDRKFSPKMGFGGGVMVQYNFYDWFGLRADLQLLQRNYKLKTLIFGESYKYKHLYSMLPMMVAFSFGGEQIRGYCDIGGYVGYWASGKYEYRVDRFGTGSGDGYVRGTENYKFDSRRDRRFDAGLSGILGISYTHPKTGIFVSMEAFLYYGLVSSHKTGSDYFRQSAYSTNIGLAVGVGYVFGRKKEQSKNSEI